MAKINEQEGHVIDRVVQGAVTDGRYLFAYYPGGGREAAILKRDIKITELKAFYEAIGRDIKRVAKGDPSVY